MTIPPPHIDTTALFVPGSWRGQLMPAEELLDDEEYRRRGDYMALRVFNARLLNPPATLEEEGFELVRIDTAANERLRDDALAVGPGAAVRRPTIQIDADVGQRRRLALHDSAAPKM